MPENYPSPAEIIRILGKGGKWDVRKFISFRFRAS
jgi:hypothetical protein